MSEIETLRARVAELQADLDNARHDLQAVHALHERAQRAEAQVADRDAEIEQLRLRVQSVESYREGHRDVIRAQAAQVAALRAALVAAQDRICAPAEDDPPHEVLMAQINEALRGEARND